jgi:hypothetical protein
VQTPVVTTQRVQARVATTRSRAKCPANESTFDLPIFASVVETRGALLEFVAWETWPIGKGTHILFVGIQLTVRMTTISAA